MAASRRELKRFIKGLERVRGRHTELVSVYVPAGYDIVKVTQHLQEEQGTAKNIQDAKTRGNVIDSLEKCVRHLRLLVRTPSNGLALFAGNIAAQEGKIDLQLFSIEPPEPLKVRMYRCDQTFMLDVLRDQLEAKECYGLVVMDRREASIGFLKGKSIKMTVHLTSGVPGKFKAGGQCLHPDTLIMLDCGDIIPIAKAHNPHTILATNLNREIAEPTPVIATWQNKKRLYEVVTRYPRFTLQASADHTFFVRTERGIEEKPLSDIQPGDYLLMPETISLDLKNQPLAFRPFIQRPSIMKNVRLPRRITPPLAQFLGYYLGDGNPDGDRIACSEERKEVILVYRRLLYDLFGIRPSVRWRDKKHYYELRAGSRILVQLCRYFFPDSPKTLTGRIPPLVLRSSDTTLAGFMRGFFDAEGYVSKGKVAFGIHNFSLAQQIQFALLRLGIVASLCVYDNRRNPYSKKPRHILAIDDRVSLQRFERAINFSCLGKRKKLQRLLQRRSNRNKVRQVLVNGSEVSRILKNAGLTMRHFACSSFFANKRQMSKEVFKKTILDRIEDPLLRHRLALFYASQLIAVKIASITPLDKQTTVDLETKSHNFLANGLIVHNSSQRFERLIAGMALEFYRRVAEACKKEFYDVKELKGLLVGGPGPTKGTFVEELPTELRKKVLVIQDLTYTDESGLHHLVDKSEDVLAKESILEEKKLMERFLSLLGKQTDLVTYGKVDVERVLDMGAVDLLLLSESLDDEEIDRLEEKARNYGTTVYIISLETTEGEQLRDLGGYGAILRYNVG